MENGWSVKKLHRLIMLSDVYQESSAYQAAGAAADPDNLLLWRYNRRRLEGEVIRDSMLLVAGKLNLKAGGPGIHPPLPEGTTPPRFGTWNVEKDDEQLLGPASLQTCVAAAGLRGGHWSTTGELLDHLVGSQ